MHEKIGKYLLTENESESCFRGTLSFSQLPIPHYQFNKPNFHLFLDSLDLFFYDSSKNTDATRKSGPNRHNKTIFRTIQDELSLHCEFPEIFSSELSVSARKEI
jgi:hypothetical protein